MDVIYMPGGAALNTHRYNFGDAFSNTGFYNKTELEIKLHTSSLDFYLLISF